MLLKGTIEVLKKVFGNDIQLRIFSSNPDEDSSILGRYDGVEFVNQIPYPVYNVKNFRRLLVSMVVGLFEYLVLVLHVKSNRKIPLFSIPNAHKKTIQSLIESDLIVGRSIDQISDVFGFATLLRNLYVIWLVKKLGKPLFLHSQTIYLTNKGLMGKVSKFMLKRSLLNVHVSVREMFSLEYLKGIGISAPFIPAPSYYPVKDFLHVFRKDPAKNYVLVVPRVALSKSELEKKAELYRGLIESMIAKYQVDVVLMGQANVSGLDDDYTLIDKIFSMLSSNAANHVTVQDIRKMEIKDFCEKIFLSKLTISERFISCLLALSMNVPVISIDPYKGKNRGILMAYRMQDFCFDQSPDADKFMDVVDRIFKNYDNVLRELREKNEKYFIDCVQGTSGWVHNNMP